MRRAWLFSRSIIWWALYWPDRSSVGGSAAAPNDLAKRVVTIAAKHWKNAGVHVCAVHTNFSEGPPARMNGGLLHHVLPARDGGVHFVERPHVVRSFS